MTEHEKTLLFMYLIHRGDLLEDEFRELQTTIRYRRIDSCDCIELSIALERLAAFREFSRDITALLKLDKPRK